LVNWIRRYKEDDGWKDRKNNPQITPIAQIELKADCGVKKIISVNQRESAKSADDKAA